MFFRKESNSQVSSNAGCRRTLREVFVWVFASLLFVAIVFVGVWGFLTIREQDYQMDGLRDAYANVSDRINQLEGKVVDLSVQMSEIRFPWSSQERLISSVDNAIPRDGRSLLPSLYDNCDEQDEFLIGDPTVGVRVVRQDLGISFTVPYDRAWGTRDYFVLPYEEKERGIIGFGRLLACGQKREFDMVATDPVSLEVTKDTAQASMDKAYGKENPVHKMDVRKINGKDVVIWYDPGMCDYVFIELIGEDHNYLFSRMCGAEDEIRDTLLEVVKTAEFVR